ncbi:MAG: hypothetical protein U9Q24_00925 [Candidatus Ratteibacteria bacterium]|nr:hypothetical protein [Candidatus Ratteibacteria bacterium]
MNKNKEARLIRIYVEDRKTKPRLFVDPPPSLKGRFTQKYPRGFACWSNTEKVKIAIEDIVKWLNEK